MPICGFSVTRATRGFCGTALALVLLFAFCRAASAQDVGLYRAQEVGGVMIDAQGVLKNATVDHTGELKRLLAENMDRIADDMNRSVELRKVSLRRLGEAIRKCRESGEPLPDEVLYLAGLQEIRYVFVYPEKHDIVLAGPGEGWKITDNGAVVGAQSGRPVLQLDDLLVALRTAREAQRMAISCSIDPTPAGIARLQPYLKQLQRQFHNTNTLGDHRRVFAQIEELLGPQNITVTVVPPTSHFARVMVAADFRMKRLAMNFEPSPLAALPSFLQMLRDKGGRMNNMMPRWWLEPRYEAVVRDPSGLAWQLGATSVKAMTEAEFLGAAGQKKHSGRADPLARKWADLMTEKYDELALADPIFAELQNCMSLAVVGALIAKEDLVQKAGDGMDTLMNPGESPLFEYNAPKQVDSMVSAVQKGRDWLISVSGGVDINSWAALGAIKTSDKLDPVRKAAVPAGDSWWWN